MAGPYRGHNMVLVVTVGVTPYTVGVVEGSDIDFGFEGGPEPYYGSRIKKHSVGTKRISFTITRWFYTDEGQEDLLLDLFDDEQEFTLAGSLIDNDDAAISDTTIELLQCKIYRWRPRTGGADDIIGEEASGYALDWDFTGFDVSTP